MCVYIYTHTYMYTYICNSLCVCVTCDVWFCYVGVCETFLEVVTLLIESKRSVLHYTLLYQIMRCHNRVCYTIS